MTVTATPRKAGPFAGTGVQTAFPFTFKIFATTDVVVTTLVASSGVQAVPVNGVDYTVAMNADQEAAPGGTVNMGVAPAVGVSLVVSSAVPSTQSVAVQNNGGFFPAVFNAEFDKLTILCQQLEERAGRALAVSIVTGGAGTITPLANGLLVWDALGQNVIAIPPVSVGTTYIGWTGRSQMSSPVDGNILLASNAGLSFGMLQFGDTTLLCPALKKVNNTLQVRLANDSGDATLTFKKQTFGDNTNNGATTSFVADAAASVVGFRNRIINGDMRIDQRRAGASVTPSTGAGAYIIDRWSLSYTQVSKLTAGQNLNGATGLAGFPKCLGIQTAAAFAVGAADGFTITQAVEGLNVVDLAWGTVSALPVTLSFWAKSSLTGTFSGSLRNAAANRSYAFAYNLLAANTWTLVSVNIPGDTAGVWAVDNTAGVYVSLSLGIGGNLASAQVGPWTAANLLGLAGGPSVVGTLGATFALTGVQLEPGLNATTQASTFERRPYALELQLCQRYYEHNMPSGSAPADGVANSFYSACSYQANAIAVPVAYKVEKRAGPTLTFYKASAANATNGLWGYLTAGAWADLTGTNTNRTTTKDFAVGGAPVIANAVPVIASGGWTADAEL